MLKECSDVGWCRDDSDRGERRWNSMYSSEECALPVAQRLYMYIRWRNLEDEIIASFSFTRACPRKRRRQKCEIVRQLSLYSE